MTFNLSPSSTNLPCDRSTETVTFLCASSRTGVGLLAIVYQFQHKQSSTKDKTFTNLPSKVPKTISSSITLCNCILLKDYVASRCCIFSLLSIFPFNAFKKFITRIQFFLAHAQKFLTQLFWKKRSSARFLR